MKQQVVSYVVTFLAGSGLTTIIVGIFLPRLLDYISNRALERYRAEIRASGFQHETRFAWFYTARAKAHSSIYTGASPTCKLPRLSWRSGPRLDKTNLNCRTGSPRL
jgi:hypothetical protein